MGMIVKSDCCLTDVVIFLQDIAPIVQNTLLLTLVTSGSLTDTVYKHYIHSPSKIIPASLLYAWGVLLFNCPYGRPRIKQGFLVLQI